MPAFFAERALLPTGWASNVRLEVAEDGRLTHVEADASAEGAERLGGPVLPGMPNLHSHAFQRAMAGLAEVAGNPNDSFWTWRDLMYRLVGRITPSKCRSSPASCTSRCSRPVTPRSPSFTTSTTTITATPTPTRASCRCVLAPPPPTRVSA